MEENKEMTEVTEAAENTAAAGNENAEERELSEEEKAEKRKTFLKKLGSDVLEIVESTFCTVFVIVLLFTYILHPVNIVGHSMYPTLNATYEGERVTHNKTDRVFMTTVMFGIKYGDILVIDKDKNYLLDENGNVYEPDDAAINECIIKRVIAVGGQTVDIHDGRVFVDGEMIVEPYIAPNSDTVDLNAFGGQYPITIPEGYFFVMGDNRNHSTDSRARSVGLVKKDQIYGKAIIKYYPYNEFDILTDSWKG